MAILVTYTTRAIDDLTFPADIQPPSNYKTEDAIARWRAAEEQKFFARAATMPFHGMLGTVCMLDPNRGKKSQYARWEPDGKTKTGSRAVDIASWWSECYEPALTPWSDVSRDPRHILVGFDPRTFIKVLASECLRAENHVDGASALPLCLWSANSWHRDMGSVLMGDNPRLSWVELTQYMGVTVPKDWTGPGQNAPDDMEVLVQLVSITGMLS